jgi:hypothetical protein
MLTHDGARLQVFLELRRMSGLQSGPEELIVLDEYTIQRPWGWVFFYTARGWKDGDFQYAIGGNGPILVNRTDGCIRLCGTGMPAHEYIEQYEAELARTAGPDASVDRLHE